MKLRNRLLALLVLPIFLLLTFAAAGLWLLRESEAAAEAVDHSADVLTQSHLLHQELLTAESSIRGFGLTHDPAFLTPWEASSSSAARISTDLIAMVRDNPSQARRAAVLSALTSRKIAALRRLVARLRAGDWPALSEAMRRGGALQLTGSISAVQHQFDREEERFSDQRRATAQRLWYDVSVSLLFSLLFGCAFAVLSILMFGQRTVHRLAQLSDATERLAAGEDIGPPLKGRDEIAQLDQTFRRMAKLLVDRQEALSRYQIIVERARDIIIVSRLADGRIVDANEAAQSAYGYTSAQMTALSLTDLREQSGWPDLALRMEKFGKDGTALYETTHHRKDGTTFPAEVSGQVTWIRGEQVILFIVRDITESRNVQMLASRAEALASRAEALEAGNEALAREIVERKRAEERLSHAAFHDELTGLPNRALFMDRLQQMVARLQRHTDHLSAVLFVDLDRFKLVNDSLGHVVGDLLLIAVARRLEKCLRPGDSLARLGGDEFTILVDDIKGEHDAVFVAERILRSLEAPFVIGGREVFASASIGIAVSRTGFDKPQDVLRNADIAMYRAKELGKGRYSLFSPDLLSRSVAQLALETDLRRAIERKEFELYYQPIVSIETGSVVGFEALIRWRHPDRGLVLPGEFISTAEETGSIVPIGLWVLETACRQMAAWQERYPLPTPLAISVNVSARQLGDGNFAADVQRILAQTAIPPESLHIEITESVLMENPHLARQTLLAVRALGVQIDLDDFGTGYSSLSYLHSFPIDTLKIDRSFVSTSGTGVANPEIVQSILALAESLSIKTTAEGIETEEQLQQLRSLNCANAQGYYFSKPVDRVAAATLIAKGVVLGNGELVADPAALRTLAQSA
jgi:diguanylate cyclase (GGDEF)-like protein/PAS domain S-box-containing protein